MNIDKTIQNIVFSLSKEIYCDTLKPGAQTVGVEIAQVASALKIITLPFAAIGLSADYLLQRYSIFLSESLEKVKVSNRIPPAPSISVPILQKVQLVFEQKSLYELYSNLFASASDKDKQSIVHPSFASIIAQLDLTDTLLLEKINTARFLPYLESVLQSDSSSELALPLVEPFVMLDNQEDNYESIAPSLQNLQRLGLIRKTDVVISSVRNAPFDKLSQSKPFEEILAIKSYERKNHLHLKPNEIVFSKGSFLLTALGRKFLSACSRPQP